jgi:LacI family transcriptional regulator
MKNEVTIKDIAKELGIHHATVSRALKGSVRVKDDTRKIILEKVKELKYEPNLLAQSFRNKKTNIISVIVPDLKHHFFSKFISDITELTHDSGYMIMVFQSNDNPIIEEKILASLSGFRVAGVVASIGLQSKSTNHFDILLDNNIPLVFFDRVPVKTPFSTVKVDNISAVGTVVDELIQRGKKRIAYVSYNNHLNEYIDKQVGYERAILRNGLSYQKCVYVKNLFLNDGYKIAPFLVDGKENPDAIICVTDEIAIGIMKYLKEMKYAIPDDISVTGFDDDPLGMVCEPNLTTVSPCTEVMVDATFDLLSKQIEGKENIKKDIILPMKFIKRDS